MKNKSFFKSAANAVHGFMSALMRERNLRIDLVVADLTLIFAYLYHLEPLGYAVLILTICTVMAAELFNTSVERLSDAVTGEYDENIKNAKDIAAASVFLTASGSVIVGICLFLTDIDKAVDAVMAIAFSKKLLILIAITLIIGLMFIVKFEKRKEDK